MQGVSAKGCAVDCGCTVGWMCGGGAGAGLAQPGVGAKGGGLVGSCKEGGREGGSGADKGGEAREPLGILPVTWPVGGRLVWV